MSAQSISEARQAANRANAQKSTGPKTVEGKAAVANNAYKHGLRSERNPLDLAADAALPHEQTQFLETLQALKDDLVPVGTTETLLLERLAQLDLRLQRALRMETAHMNLNAEMMVAELTAAGSTIATDTGATRNNGLSMLAFLRDPNALTLIGRYESRLARDFARTLTQFHQAQKLRKQTQPSEACAISTRSLASDGQIAPPVPPQTQYHVSNDVAHAEPRIAQTNSAEQTQPSIHSLADTQATTENPTPKAMMKSPTPLEQEAA